MNEHDDKSEAITLIKGMQRRSIAGLLVTGLLCLVLIGLMTVAAFTDPNFEGSSLGGKIAGGVFMVLLLGVAIMSLVMYIKKLTNESPVIQALENAASESLTKAELLEVRASRGRPAWVVVFYMADGKKESMNFTATQRVELIRVIGKFFPNAEIVDKTTFR